MARRLAPTLADYMAIAISPALIMGLVGSLAFFLLDLSYRGEHMDRLQWILSWFVMAIVLIARIAIVEGAERASMFGVALAGAMLLAVLRFAPEFFLITPFLIALIWWCAHELTWNCTWIDDDEDPGGEGLLQAAGLDRPEANGETLSTAKPTAAPAPPPPRREKPWWMRLSTQKRRRARAPGVTIVWFSLAALPIFGLGQLAIPVDETARRQHVFWLATIYVGCGLGLLLTTAFLGLRRYLRRRGLEMPASISGGWLLLGGLMIAALLIAGALLPRPSAEYSLAQVAVEAGKEALGASRWAVLSGSAGKGEGAAGGEGEHEAQQEGEGQGQSKSDGEKGQASSSGKGNKQGSQGQSGEKGEQGQGSSQGKGGGNSQGKGQSSGKSQGQGSEGKQGGGQQSKQGRQEQGNQSDRGEAGKNGQSGQDSRDGERSGDQSKDGQEKAGEDQAKGKSGGEQRSRGGGSGSKQNEQGDRSQPSQGARPPSEAPSSQPLANMARQASNLLQSLSGIARVLKWLLVATAVVFFVWQFGPELLRMLNAFVAWLQALFGGNPSPEAEEAEMPSEEVLRRLSFSQFSDPFLSGVADRATPEQLVAYTFAGLEAWGREAGLERTADQTPLEYAERLAARFPQLEALTTQTAEFYTYLAYGPGRLTPQVRGPLESLWQALRSEGGRLRGDAPNWQPAS
ncbi:MAG: DUF4129 domain-containing protein [Pirellulales bacterium]